jgi:endo-1,3(4)-beta-glucanase
MLWHLLIVFGLAHANILKPIGTDYPAEEGTSRIKASRQQENLLPPINLMQNLQYRQAIPTNDWWGNLITRDDNLKIKPIFSEPYRIEVQTTAAPFGIQISYPYQYRFHGPLNANGAIQYYGHALGIQNIGFSATTFQAPKLHITKWDDVGVSVVLSDTGGTIEADFVRGMAFVSAYYTGLTPMLQTDHAITQFKQVHARKYIIQLNNGQKWAVYSSQDITLTQDGQRLIGDRKFFGVLRTALITAENSDENQYDAFAECQVVGGTVQASSSKRYTIVWKTKGLCNNGLLHFALVHHMDTLQSKTYETSGIKLNSATHGSMTGIVVRSKKWNFNEPEDVKIGFYPPRSPSREHMMKYRILELLQQDIRASWSIPQGGSYYFNGKAAQKYASLCLMASDPAVVGNDQTLKTECIRKLQGIYTT